MWQCSIRTLMMVVAITAVCLVVIPLISPVYRTDCTWTLEMQCASRIHNVALAILSYQSENGSFPQGTAPNADLRPDERLSLYAPLTPYMEYPEIYENIDETLPWHSGVNRSIAGERIGILRCPYLPSVVQPGPQPTTTIGLAGLGADSPLLPKTDPRAGIFGYDRATTPADIKDGAGTTMMLAESGIVVGSWLQGGPATVRGLDPNKKPYLGSGRQFGGLHGRVAAVAMADGSVRTMSESIDPRVFEAMSTMAGGENIGDK